MMKKFLVCAVVFALLPATAPPAKRPGVAGAAAKVAKARRLLPIVMSKRAAGRLGPWFSISASNTVGTSPFAWAVTATRLDSLTAPLPGEVGKFTFHHEGRFSVRLAGMAGWRLLFDCTMMPSSPSAGVTWDAKVSEAGYVNGVASRDSATGTYFFVTPVGDGVEGAVVNIQAPRPSGPDAADRFEITQCDVTPFN